MCGPHGRCLLTSNNREDFGGISEVNSYYRDCCMLFGFSWYFCYLQDNAQPDEKT